MSRYNTVSRIPFEVDITDLTHDGRGVARIDGKTVFVAGALPGERARVRLAKRHRHFDEAQASRAADALAASASNRAARISAPAAAARCSTSPPAAQIAAKQRVLAENFERIGKVAPAALARSADRRAVGLSPQGPPVGQVGGEEGQGAGRFPREQNPRFVADLSECHTLLPEVGERIGRARRAGRRRSKRSATIPQIEIAAGDDTRRAGVPQPAAAVGRATAPR